MFNQITTKMKLAAAESIAGYIKTPTADLIIPSALDKEVACVVAEAVKAASTED